MPVSKSKRKSVLRAERAERTRQQGGGTLTSHQALREIERLVNLPETVLTDWSDDLQPVLQHACEEFSNGEPVIYRDNDGRPVVIASNPDGPGWVVIDDFRDGKRRLRLFLTDLDVTGVPA